MERVHEMKKSCVPKSSVPYILQIDALATTQHEELSYLL